MVINLLANVTIELLSVFGYVCVECPTARRYYDLERPTANPIKRSEHPLPITPTFLYKHRQYQIFL